jgi:hypothetical protein
LNPRLLALIDSGELDWDNPRHREAYLRAWVNGELKVREGADKCPATNTGTSTERGRGSRSPGD